MFEIEEYRKIHIIGVGGIGMSALAHIFLQKGYRVSGSDQKVNENVERLIDAGLEFFNSHHEKNVEGSSLVLYSTAVNEENLERIAAKKLKIREIHRGKMVAMLMNESFGIAVSGAHGKTTTTSILISLFLSLGLDPSGIVGGVVKEVGSNAIVGDSEYFIAEADESDGSFLNFFPNIAIVTNIDEDHLDFYKNLENIEKAFLQFSQQIPTDGFLVLNADDTNSVEIIKKVNNCKTFGIIENADYRAINITNQESGTTFELVYRDQKIKVETSLSGDYNISNLLASIAATHCVYSNLVEICNAVTRFQGAGRRFDILIDTKDLVVVDDYAHHPTEINAVLKSVKRRYPKRKLITVFQPHRFSRTQDFWNEFVSEFYSLDEIHISDVYAACEKEIEGINTKKLISCINTKAKRDVALYLNDWSEIKEIFFQSVSEPSVILFLGAGSISTESRKQVELWIKS